MTYDETTYGERIADVYDGWHPREDRGPVVDALAALADGGRALELGIGTGNVALPLAGHGVEVHGIDSSPSMVARLREKPGGDAIPVSIGTFARFELEGTYRLVYVVATTFMCLLTQDEQVDCFASVARHLEPGGLFVVEAFTFDRQRHAVGNQAVRAGLVEPDLVHVTAERYDPVEQTITSSEIVIRESGIKLFPVKLRYAPPAELDLMGRLAGLRLRSRSGGWRGEPFTATSPAHVSVYEKA